MPTLGRRRASRASALLASTLAWGCLSSPTAPAAADEIRIRVEVSGGLAAADYAYIVDGSAGAVVGERCVSLCSFKAGEVLLPLSADQIINLSRMLVDAGILDADHRDFGTQCCDQFYFVLEYREGNVERSVRGSSEALPPAIARAIATLNRLLEGRAPVIVAFHTRPADWPRDPLDLVDVALEADLLVLQTRYGGGCTLHALDLVAWGGWLESFPVQVNVLLTHDAKGDRCKALVSRTLRFDLTPLAQAYRAAYCPGGAERTTLVLRLAGPWGQDPSAERRIEYTF